MEPLHLVRPIAASAREVVAHVRGSFVAGCGEVSLVDVSGQTFALLLPAGPSTSHAVWTSIIVRDTAAGCVLVGRYRGRRGVSGAWIAVGSAWVGALLLGAPLLSTTLVMLVVFAVLLVLPRGTRKRRDPEAFAVMCAALDGVLMPLPLASPYRAALAPLSTPDESVLPPNVQSHTHAGEVTKMWALPPHAHVASPPAAPDPPAPVTPVPPVIVDISRAPPLSRTTDPLRCRIDVAAEPAHVHAHLCAAFPENADASTIAAHTEDATLTGFVLIRTSTDPRQFVASVHAELLPLPEGTRIELRWSRFRMQRPTDWLVYMLMGLIGLALMAFEPLRAGLGLLALVVYIWFVHFRRGRRAAAEFDMLARELQVALVSLPAAAAPPRPMRADDGGAPGCL